MKITDFLDVKAATADLKSQNKEEVISDLVDIVVETGGLDKQHKASVMETLMAREALGSTAIGQGIAIPHGKSDNVTKLVGSIGVSKEGVNFDSLDGEPVYIFFLLIAPVDSAGPHLKALARISKFLKDKYIRENLKSATSSEDIIQLIKQEEGLSTI